MTNITPDHAEYLAQRLIENIEKLSAFSNKMYADICAEIPIEDRVQLRDLLLDNAALSRSLLKSVSAPATTTPVWKRLLRK